MRASILCVTAALIAAGCSHNKKEETTTELLRQQPPAAEAETQGGYTGAGAQSGNEECPMAVTGTTLRTEDTSGGVALVFLTSGDVSELRQRVRHMADMHNRMQSGSQSMNMPQSRAPKGPPSNSMPGSGMYDTQGSGTPGGGSLEGDKSSGGGSMGMQTPSSMQGGRHGMMPTSTARAEDVDGGAQLILIATDPSQTDALRQSAREVAQDMAAGNCSMMMGMQGQGGMQQQQDQQQQMQQQQMQQEQQLQQPYQNQIPQNTLPPNGMQNESNDSSY